MKKRKLMAPILAGLMIFSGGCSDTSTSSQDSKDGEVEELDFFMHASNGYFIFNDDWATFKEAAEKTGIKLKGTAPKSSTNSVEAFNLMIASGEIPELVHGQKKYLNKFGMEGAFLPLNDLIKEHAPNIQKYIEEDEAFLKANQGPDGNLYMVPYISDGVVAETYFIRQDWLDKLNLETPQNVDEFYNVLKAFKEKDPNGNGKQDEVPYFSESNILGLSSLWGAFDDVYIENGEIKYGPYENKFSTAMENLAAWYEEGLLDQEIFTRQKSREYLLGNNLGGASRYYPGSTAGYNDTLKESVPGINFVVMSPPENTEGKRIEPTKRSDYGNNLGVAISAEVENPEKMIKYLDFFYSEEGRRLMNYGIEGETYEMKNGKPQFTEKALTANDGNIVENLRSYGAQVPFSFHQDFEYEKLWMNPIAVKGIEEYTKGDYFIEEMPNLSFTEEEEKILTDIGTQIRTYKSETVQKWIMGADKINHDEFKKRLQDMGFEKFIEVYNEAYKRYQNS
ncbi:putative aldouronate transport system substrate-binding protein [Bacillus pakistanensis]|uniref:Aldouronate transport system substrate-binding protein n=1 Tax=Rossellomorea pakistanensis TaxID=992288 RepID=A0ABS2NCF9_9BACI|nr:extracellular solute-binding protein [Bacillus pakistanensis]MBM7585543.1 putative aldouronate transport system substrate-binding protein [Bacillus pakistanensis]